MILLPQATQLTNINLAAPSFDPPIVWLSHITIRVGHFYNPCLLEAIQGQLELYGVQAVAHLSVQGCMGYTHSGLLYDLLDSREATYHRALGHSSIDQGQLVHYSLYRIYSCLNVVYPNGHVIAL